MSLSIRELKKRYKLNAALGRVPPVYDRAIALPLSTGKPLFDAALVDKIKATATLNEPEHIGRAWHLVRTAADADVALLEQHRARLLNDYKNLLALRAWQDGDPERCRRFLDALPWRWRFAFPTAVVKPAAALFTGWRRNLSLRLVDDPRYPALREQFRHTLAAAPPVALLKYRATIKESAALLRYRFEGDRERAIHALCFDKGRGLAAQRDLEPIGGYFRAREALAAGGVAAMLDALEHAEQVIPITSYMGMLGGAGVRLTDDGPERARLRDYAVRCATAVESLLRLAEWGPWMTEAHAEALSRNVRHQVIERGLDVPFFKVVKAFNRAPPGVRKMILTPLFQPLLRHFGATVARRLGEPGPITFAQPCNVLHLMSFLLYAVVSTAMPANLLLLRGKGADTVPALDVDEVVSHLADSPAALEQWLLSELGGLTSRYSHVYDFAALAVQLGKLDPAAPLILDLPFTGAAEVLDALLPFERVFNLNEAYGAPGELVIAQEYYEAFFMRAGGRSAGIYGRYSDIAAERFAETLDRLDHFAVLSEAS